MLSLLKRKYFFTNTKNHTFPSRENINQGRVIFYAFQQKHLRVSFLYFSFKIIIVVAAVVVEFSFILERIIRRRMEEERDEDWWEA